MEPFLVVGLVLVVAAAAVLLAMASAKAAKQRREELAAWAGSRGWRFDDDGSATEEFRRVAEFRRGHNRYAYNTIAGALTIKGREFPVACGDYHFRETRGSGKNRRTVTVRFSYVSVRVPGSPPDLTIRPEGFFDKVVQAFGADDIDFESDQFSRAFCVTCPEKKFAYDVVSPRMMEHLLATRPPAIFLVGGHVCLVAGNRTWAIPEYEREIARLAAFFELWPEFVLEDLALRGVG
jgi:hypothetical protein